MKIKRTRLISTLLIVMGVVFFACEGPDQPVYDADNPDPNPPGSDPATITSINPASGYFSEEVTITGTNFDTNPDKNVVQFGNRVGTITNATSTEITVITPGIIGDSVDVRVAVAGSEFWSNTTGFVFKELPDVHEITVIDEEINWPNGVAVDSDENVYIGSAGDEVIYKITPTGDKSEFASVPVNGAIHFGPGGYLYVCVGAYWEIPEEEGKIVRISADGNTIEDYVQIGNPTDFDWDADGNMYIISNGWAVSKYANGSVTLLAEVGDAKTLRVYENNLYVSAIWEGTIWKFDITSDGLENQEAFYEGSDPSSFEMASNGLMILAEAWDTSLYTMFQDGSLGPVMYEEELETPMRYMCWHGKSIYVVYPGWGDVGKALKVNIGLEQAPRYGQQ